MATGWSERVREVADADYVQPARSQRSRIRIRFGELKSKMVRLGLPASNANQVASPLESPKFWEPRGLEMCSPKGQPRKVNTVFEFRFIDETVVPTATGSETPDQRAKRLVGRLRGLMKDEIASFGGAEAFMRWVRSDETEP